jgi:hypothetical protein
VIIYKTTNTVNGKIYVGKDKHNSPSYLGSGKRLQEAIRKYGKNVFVKEVLGEYGSEEEWLEAEKYWISKLQSNDRTIGYNLTDGGEGGNTKKYWTKERLQEYKDNHTSKVKLTGRTALSQKGKHITELMSPEQVKKWKENYTVGIEKTTKRRKEGNYTEKELESYRRASLRMQGTNNHRATKVECLETGTVYGSVKEAMIAHGYKSLTKIQNSYRNGKPTSDGYTFRKVQ